MSKINFFNAGFTSISSTQHRGDKQHSVAGNRGCFKCGQSKRRFSSWTVESPVLRASL